jgi:hypothetical protein
VLKPTVSCEVLMNLMEGLIAEANRCRELVKEYEAIGPAGAIGALLIKQKIQDAERAMGSGDVLDMLKAYEGLKGCA